MKALILAAGYATRLYPLTVEYPKPLLTVKDRPIIDYILDELKGIDEINEIIVITNSKFFHRFEEWRHTIHSKKHLTLVDDLTKDNTTRLGAIGDVNFAIENNGIKSDLLVIGGDNLFDGDLKDFLSFARAGDRHPAIGIYNVRNTEEARHYGIVKLDKKNKIVDFKEKPKNPKSTLAAMCLYYFPKENLGLIKEYMSDKTRRHDATGFYIDWLRKRVAVYGFVFNGRWYDIGDHKFYNEAKATFVK